MLTTKQEAIKLAQLCGREWLEMGAYEREQYMDEVRKIDCDCCGGKYYPEDILFIHAVDSGAAQSDTVVCNFCNSSEF